MPSTRDRIDSILESGDLAAFRAFLTSCRSRDVDLAYERATARGMKQFSDLAFKAMISPDLLRGKNL